MLCKQTTLSFVLVKMQRGKRLRSQTQRRLLRMSMTISRKPVGVRGLKGLSKEPVMLWGFHVPPSRDYGKRKLTLVELRFPLQQRDIDFPDSC